MGKQKELPLDVHLSPQEEEEAPLDPNIPICTATTSVQKLLRTMPLGQSRGLNCQPHMKGASSQIGELCNLFIIYLMQGVLSLRLMSSEL